MGGAYGHAGHVFEDLSLTFGDLKSLLHRIAAADLEDVIEKTDGQNLLITHDGSQLRAARNKGDLISGGMTAQGLAAKFAGRGTVSNAFTQGFDVVAAAVAALSPAVRKTAFGDGDIWHSIEVMYSKNTNVINYGIDAIAFHRFANRVYDEAGDPVDDPRADRAFAALMSQVETMRKAAAQERWKLFAPTVGRLEALADDSHLERALSAVGFAMDTTGMTDSDTLGDHAMAAAEAHIGDAAPGLSTQVLDALARRSVMGDGPTLRDTLARLRPETRASVKDAVSGVPDAIGRAMQPIERAVTGLSIELLRGLDSVFVVDNTGEVKRLRAELKSALDAIQSVGGTEARGIVARQMARLAGGIQDVGTAAEGIMFRDPKSGKVYKLTGAFAAVNAIIGLFKYGRGKIPPIQKQTEAVVRSLVRSFIVTG